MTPTQREAALRLADYFTYNFWPGGLNTSGFDETAALLRELAAEPQSDCGEAGHTEGRCGNAACLRGLAEPQSEPVAEDDSYRAVPPKHVATYYAHPPQQRKPLTDEFVSKVVRSVQPNLSDTCRAWKYEFAQCKHWLDAAHGIGEAP